MSQDDPSVDSYLAMIQPEAMGTEMRLRAMQKADAGFVVWDAVTPQNEQWSVHKNNFLEALYTALAFCGTDARFEWCVLGSGVFALVRTLDAFKQCEPIVTNPLVFVGRIKTVSVYVPVVTAVVQNPLPDQRRLILSGRMFYAGVDERCAHGQIQNQAGAAREEALVW